MHATPPRGLEVTSGADAEVGAPGRDPEAETSLARAMEDAQRELAQIAERLGADHTPGWTASRSS